MRLLRKRGFTLIEILVALALLAITGGIAALISADQYRGSMFRSDRDVLIALLQRARSLSINNRCDGECTDGRPHGVRIEENRFVLFQGESWDSRDEEVDAAFPTHPGTREAGVNEIVFAQLTGNVTGSGDIVLFDERGFTSTTSVGALGQISWSN